MTNAIDLLIGHHRELETQFQALKKGIFRDAKSFQNAAAALTSHITVEEELFYPAVREERTEDILLESLEEHLSLKRVLADLLAIEPTDEKFIAKMHVLAEQAQHHNKEEEEHLFPKAKRLLSDSKLSLLGEKMAARMEALQLKSVRNQIPAQTQDSASLA